MYREDIVSLVPENSTCIELGVAEGEFAELVLSKYNVFLYGVDAWNSEEHDVDQYLRAVHRLEKFGDRSIILRKTFNEAVLDFPDEYFDLIYIDGYAAKGQENGRTLSDWWPKLKPGGIFSGDDYSPKYPHNTLVVYTFLKARGLDFKLTDQYRNTVWSNSPSWYTRKP